MGGSDKSSSHTLPAQRGPISGLLIEEQLTRVSKKLSEVAVAADGTSVLAKQPAGSSCKEGAELHLKPAQPPHVVLSDTAMNSGQESGCSSPTYSSPNLTSHQQQDAALGTPLAPRCAQDSASEVRGLSVTGVSAQMQHACSNAVSRNGSRPGSSSHASLHASAPGSPRPGHARRRPKTVPMVSPFALPEVQAERPSPEHTRSPCNKAKPASHTAAATEAGKDRASKQRAYLKLPDNPKAWQKDPRTDDVWGKDAIQKSKGMPGAGARTPRSSDKGASHEPSRSKAGFFKRGFLACFHALATA